MHAHPHLRRLIASCHISSRFDLFRHISSHLVTSRLVSSGFVHLQELDETKTIAPSRIVRIARGSGHHPMEVMELLEQFKMMQTTMQKTMKKKKKMGKAGMYATRCAAAAALRM
eukprot:4528294-Pleurochrysis_carterae.AAC.1